jgi:hypothetical protein
VRSLEQGQGSETGKWTFYLKREQPKIFGSVIYFT